MRIALVGTALVTYSFLRLTLEHLFLDLWGPRPHMMEQGTPVEAASDGGDRVYVVSMQGTPGVHASNQERLDDFLAKWKEKCGLTATKQTMFEHCPGIHDPRRGYGLTISFLLCLQRAKDLGEKVAFVFEDDARLLDDTLCDKNSRAEYLSGLPDNAFLTFLGGHTWKYPKNTTGSFSPLSPQPFRETLSSYGCPGGEKVAFVFEDDARLLDVTLCDKNSRAEYLSGLPDNVFLTFLGGHRFKYPKNTTGSFSPLSPQPFRETSRSFGTYGFAVPQHSLDILIETIKDDLLYGQRKKDDTHLNHKYLTVEKNWYLSAQKHNLKMYAANPLLVWHQGGYSNT
eukprot:CAMPEP_0113599868 /NCGR_PEP_ID=MMETSP0015_2-20120614/42394_1 /TAXON_ID=2838 /ORGANISM="Odontella" /LENGTH=340 /DNA_ID=CAMNT_0000508069 /DNA_START=159 /DNA_END=1176 /DNA_ORIENTATION=- /assembly_acc=CAM_ASM_000160